VTNEARQSQPFLVRSRGSTDNEATAAGDISRMAKVTAGETEDIPTARQWIVARGKSE